MLIVCVGVALRLWLIHASALDPRFSDADDGDYYRRALRVAVTGQYVDDNWLIRPPLHVFFFALWLRVGLLLGRPALGILLIELAQTAVAALTILLGHGIARRLFGSNRAGLCFAAFLSLWFSFVEQPTVLFGELIYLFLFLLHIWLLLRFDASGRRHDLALSGVALGAAALTRSPALYSLAFVVLWLAVRAVTNDQRPTTKGQDDRPTDQRPTTKERDDRPRPTPQTPSPKSQAPSPKPQAPALWTVVRHLCLVILCCLAVVLPWTARNYIVYQRFIPIDTLGQINLWLDLDPVDKRNEHISALRKLPQADRAAYAMARAREILAADPLRPLRPMWRTFRHIWKAQFVEDYFVKSSLFSRPLRDAAPLGLAGDLLWLAFTVGGLIGLAAPTREGLYNRLFFLAWLGYSLLTVLIFHVEPRYLLPIWTLLGLYGAWVLASMRWPFRRSGKETRRQGDKETASMWISRSPGLLVSLSPFGGRWSMPAQATIVVAFLALLLTYRDYPAIVATGLARERAMVAGERAYAAGDYPAAEREFRAATEDQPSFVDARVDLALALAAQGRRDEARALLRDAGGSRQADFLAGILARDSGDVAAAVDPLADAELTAGEDIQAWAVEWLRPPATDALALDGVRDLGYIAGFSGSERGPAGSYRWLEGDGRVALPLAQPLRGGAALSLRMASGRPSVVPLDVWIADRWAGRVSVAPGGWRAYRLPIPAELAGGTRLDIRLSAPTFVPARADPASDDPRALSLMIGQVRVQ